MANYSKFLSLISGADRTVDLSAASSVLELGGAGLQMDGSTSGHVVISASAVTSTYSIVWPSAQAASSGYVLTNDGTGVLSWSPAAATGVTSVALALPVSVFTVSGSPVTSSGTLTGSFATQSANTVFAGPGTGSAATPTFRSLVAADIPSLTGVYATISLNNLASTAVNASIVPASAGTINLGSSSLPWNEVFTGIVSFNGGGEVDLVTSTLLDSTAVAALVFSPSTRTLNDGVGTAQLSWGTSGITIEKALLLDGSTSGALTQLASATTTSYSITWPAAQASGSQVLQNNGSGVLSWISAATGSVTSVAFADDSTTPIYTVSGSPVTSSGTLAITLATQSANTVFAGPSSGSAAQPAFRGLVSADIPNNAANTTGTASNITATSNSTLTTLSALSLPTSQLSGTISAAQMLPLATNDIYVGNGSAQPAAVAMSGDATIVSSGALTLATVNSNTGSFGSSTSIPSFTVNAKGLITAASGNVVIAPAGTLSGTTLNSSVVTSSLTSLGIQSSALNMGSNQINNVSNPTSAQDAATKSYVDAAIAGLTWKGPVEAYAASNVPLTGSTPLVIDGYTVLNGDLLLLSAQSTASQDGEYAAAISGGSYTLTANGLPNAIGDAWLVLNGTVYADSAFVATAAVPAATFIEFAGPTAYTFSAPLVLTGRTVSITQASTSTNGYLSSTDWNTFNNKQPAGSYITALTGDGTAAGPGSAVFTLATVATAGTTGSSTSIPSITINAKGLVTSVTGNVVIAPAGTLTGTTLASNVVSSSLTSVGTITTGVWNGTAIAIANGGTGQTSAASAFAALSPLTTAGDLIYENATPAPARLAIGTTGQVLTVSGGLPVWATPATSGTVTSVAFADDSTTPIYTVSGSPVTSSGTLAITLATQTANTVFAGPSSGAAAQPAFRALVSQDIPTDNVTLDQAGAGNTIEIKAAGVSATQLATGAFDQVTITGGAGTAASVAASPSLKRTLIAGQSFSANTSYAVRWGITANGETAGRVYAADITTSSFDLFYVIGMASSATSVSIGGNIKVTSMGSFSLSSSDTAFASATDGEAVFLTASGTFSVTAPSSAGQAVTRIGMVQVRSATVTSNIIDVWPQVVGVN